MAIEKININSPVYLKLENTALASCNLTLAIYSGAFQSSPSTTYELVKNEFDGIDSKLLNLNFDTLFSRNWYSGGDLFLDQNRFVIGLEYNHFNPSNNKERYISLGRAYFEDGEPNIGEFNLTFFPLNSASNIG